MITTEFRPYRELGAYRLDPLIAEEGTVFLVS